MEGRATALAALAVLLLAAQLHAAPLFSDDFQGFNTNTTSSVAPGPALGSHAGGIGCDVSRLKSRNTDPTFINYATTLGYDATELDAGQTSESDDGFNFVPEPVALLALGVGMVSLGGVIRRCRQASPVFLTSW